MKIIIPVIIIVSVVVGVTLGMMIPNPTQNLAGDLIVKPVACPPCVIECGPEPTLNIIPIGETEGVREYKIFDVGDYNVITNEGKVYKRFDIEDSTPLLKTIEPITKLEIK